MSGTKSNTSSVGPVLDLFSGEIKAVNLGLESFAENLRANGVAAVQVLSLIHI